MKPLIVLLASFILVIVAIRLFTGQFNIKFAARIAMATMLLFTAIGHFMFPEGMALMIPNFIPYKLEMVYITALIEIVGAVGLIIPQTRYITGWLLVIFFVLMLPANIKASLDNLNYQTGTFDGPGTIYLWFRVPLQVLFILWVYISSIKFS